MRSPVWAFAASFPNDAHERSVFRSALECWKKRKMMKFKKIKKTMQFEHTSWSEMLFKGPYRIGKVLAIKSIELNVTFVVHRMT